MEPFHNITLKTFIADNINIEIDKRPAACDFHSSPGEVIPSIFPQIPAAFYQSLPGGLMILCVSPSGIKIPVARDLSVPVTGTGKAIISVSEKSHLSVSSKEQTNQKIPFENSSFMIPIPQCSAPLPLFSPMPPRRKRPPRPGEHGPSLPAAGPFSASSGYTPPPPLLEPSA